MNKKRVAVESVQLGMWVVELDRPWAGTPFDFQGFPVTSEDQIATLESWCKVVFVDPEREQWVPSQRQSQPLRGAVVYAEVTPVETEVVVAKEIYTSCEEAVQRSLEGIRREGQIDTGARSRPRSAA